MTLLRLSPTAIARSRFALSPLAETVGSLKALWLPQPRPWLEPWHRQNQSAFHDWLKRRPIAFGLVSLISTTKWLPDVVAIPPGAGMNTTMDQELEDMSSHSDHSIGASITKAITASWCQHDRSWLPATRLASHIANVMQEAWQQFVLADWLRRRAILERDIIHRTGILATNGWQQAVNGMTRRSAWVGSDSIRFSDQLWPERHLTDEGLIFVPYSAGQGSWICEQHPRHALVYPARGMAAATTAASPDALAIVFGRGRARIMSQLGQPTSSSQLAAILNLSLGTVSSHLASLHEAGIVTKARAGRKVLYRLTNRGKAIAAQLNPSGNASEQSPRGTSAHQLDAVASQLTPWGSENVIATDTDSAQVLGRAITPVDGR